MAQYPVHEMCSKMKIGYRVTKNGKSVMYRQYSQHFLFRQTLGGKVLPTHSRLNNYSEVNGDEMQVFMALWIAFGLTQKPDLESYWSTDEVLSTPFYSTIMSRNSFK